MLGETRLMRRLLIGGWFAAAVIIAGYYALWRYAAGVMETSVIDWVDEQRAAGLTINHGAIQRNGFPFFLRVDIDAPQIESPHAFTWKAERLSIDALPYDLNRLIFTPSGKQLVSANGIGDWSYAAESIRASIAHEKSRGWVFSMNVDNASAIGADGSESRIGTLVYDLAPSVNSPTTLTLNLVAAGYSFHDGQRDIAVDQLQTSISLSQTDVWTGHDPARRWRDAGGALDIHGLNATIDGAQLSVSGSVSLDRENRPEGVLKTIVTKPAGLAGALTRSGALSREEADAAIAGLTLAAMAQGGRIEAPIELHAGAATIGGAKVADLPTIP